MVITAVRQTKKGRFALFSEDGFLFSLDSETFFAEHIEEGSAFSDAELALLRAKSETRKACDKALQYLSLRAYAAGELYQKLCLKFDERSAAAAVAKVENLGMLDDAAFARQRAEYLAKRNKSPMEIRRPLAARGVGREEIELALAPWRETDGEGVPPAQQAILRLLEKSYGAKLAAGKRDNVCAALARRGFSHGDIRAALALYEQNDQEDTL